MTPMRFASYNVEWMNGLFSDGVLQLDNKPSAREETTRKEQAQAVAQVLQMVDADVFLILEAPNEYETGACVRALEHFADHFGLRQNRALLGHASGTDQEIALLYDPKKIIARFQAHSHKDAPSFDEEFITDLPGADHGRYRFSKPPLEAQIVDKENDFAFRLIGVHLKTKAPHGASNDEEAVKIGFNNRRKQIAQARWVRARIDHMHFPFIVAGDLNDGPGFDEYEAVLGLSSVDILTENDKLYDPALEASDKLSSARFLKREDQSYIEALLDYVFVSQEMRPFAKNWRIWHPLQDPKLSTDPEIQKIFLQASDHFPVSIDLAF